jgi:hypothetical protein
MYSTLLYSGVMKTITIRVSDETHARWQHQAEQEGVTVTALVTEAVDRDPRLDHGGAEATADFLAKYGAEFAAAYPEEEPDAATGAGQAA